MSKLFKLTTLSILSLIAIFGLFNNVSTEASTQYTVNAKSGLNFRNQNCKIIKTLRYGTKVNGTSGSITCKVNGINYKMINTADGYAAEKFLSAVTKPTPSPNGTYTVNAPSGLNLRDRNCGRVTTVRNGIKLGRVNNDDIFDCTISGKVYTMYPVIYNGKDYHHAAKVFLK